MWLSDGQKAGNKFIICSNKNDKLGNYDKSLTRSRLYSFDVGVEWDLGAHTARMCCAVAAFAQSRASHSRNCYLQRREIGMRSSGNDWAALQKVEGGDGGGQVGLIYCW